MAALAVRIRGSLLYLDFYFYLPNGARTRAFEPMGKNIKKNQPIAKSKDKAIQYHLKSGTFYYPDFFPHGAKNKHFKTDQGILFSDWWDELMSESSNRESSIILKQSAYRTHIAPYFGQTPIHEITEHEALLFRKTLEGKGLAPASINSFMGFFCTAMSKAQKRGLTEVYACEDIGLLKRMKTEILPLSFDELRHFLDTLKKVDKEFHDLILFWSRTGLRPGEFISVMWDDLDTFNNVLQIRRTRSNVTQKEGPPKTITSERDVDLRPAVLETLARQKERIGLSCKYIWPFRGKQYSHKTLGRRFKHYLRISGLKPKPAVHMRHTFATLHIAAGESITWVSKMLGHSNVRVTLEKYNRFIPNLTRNDGSAFEMAFEKSKKGNIKVMERISI